jgi:hypothetical protein
VHLSYSVCRLIVKAIRPYINLGLFWMEYCAFSGTALNAQTPAVCRHQGRVQGLGYTQTPFSLLSSSFSPLLCTFVRAQNLTSRLHRCWGEIKGRLVYSNVFYHRRGNYPEELLYSCANHAAEDERDEAYHKCQSCECLLRPASMWTELVCRTCYDRSNLQNKVGARSAQAERGRGAELPSRVEMQRWDNAEKQWEEREVKTS